MMLYVQESHLPRQQQQNSPLYRMHHPIPDNKDSYLTERKTSGTGTAIENNKQTTNG